jgi:hypothetical protein
MINDTVVRADDVLSDHELGVISGGSPHHHHGRAGASGACSYKTFSFLGYLEIGMTTCSTISAKT